jgi:hypothetical protein
MRAIRFKTFGDPSVLEVVEIAPPAIDKTMALVRTMAASINPSGVDTLKYDLTASAAVLEALTPGFLAGDYRSAPITETCGLGDAQEAYRKVAAGSSGRVVLRPQE